jgi:citronellol/citronellal dehydrogenase
VGQEIHFCCVGDDSPVRTEKLSREAHRTLWWVKLILSNWRCSASSLQTNRRKVTLSEKDKELKGKTLFITGASRGIGLEIAKRAALDGANIVIAAKSESGNAKLPGTIYTAAKEVEEAGGAALAIKCDVRIEDEIKVAIDEAVNTFGGIDILVNNASALSMTSTENTDLKRFRLMHEINPGGAFFAAKHAIPRLRKSANPHILTMSPPLAQMSGKWLGPQLAYAMSKYAMSMITMGLATELAADGIAANSLWPKTLIDTAAVRHLPDGDELVKHARTAKIVADAAYHILTRPARECTGNFFVDEEVLRSAGVEDLDRYAAVPGNELHADIFLD